MKDLIFFAFDCINDCGGADILRIVKFVFTLLDIVLFIVPIGLIVMIMMDFSKNVIAGKEDEMKKNVSIVIKRIIYCMVLFLIPTIVRFAIGLVSDVGVTAAECMDWALNKDLSICEVDYENFGSEVSESCFYCRNSNIYKWSNDVPNDTTCLGGWEYSNKKEENCK